MENESLAPEDAQVILPQALQKKYDSSVKKYTANMRLFRNEEMALRAAVSEIGFIEHEDMWLQAHCTMKDGSRGEGTIIYTPGSAYIESEQFVRHPRMSRDERLKPLISRKMGAREAIVDVYGMSHPWDTADSLKAPGKIYVGLQKVGENGYSAWIINPDGAASPVMKQRCKLSQRYML